MVHLVGMVTRSVAMKDSRWPASVYHGLVPALPRILDEIGTAADHATQRH
jgi:hypothetical protein